MNWVQFVIRVGVTGVRCFSLAMTLTLPFAGSTTSRSTSTSMLSRHNPIIARFDVAADSIGRAPEATSSTYTPGDSLLNGMALLLEWLGRRGPVAYFDFSAGTTTS